MTLAVRTKELRKLDMTHGGNQPKWHHRRCCHFHVVRHNIEVIKWNSRMTTTTASFQQQQQPPLSLPLSSFNPYTHPSYTVSHALQSALCRETLESHSRPLRALSSVLLASYHFAGFLTVHYQFSSDS